MRPRPGAERQQQADLETLENMQATYGLEPDDLVAALVAASMRKRTGPPPPRGENTDRNAAKSLRAAGHNVDASHVRRLRQLIERYLLELLPESLRPTPTRSFVPPQPEPNNVVKSARVTEQTRRMARDLLPASGRRSLRERLPVCRSSQPARFG
jgi:hypothetical protein